MIQKERENLRQMNAFAGRHLEILCCSGKFPPLHSPALQNDLFLSMVLECL